MKRMIAAVAAIGLTVAGVGGCSALSASSDYPTDDVTFVIPYKPGGTSDPMGRAFARQMEKELGESVVVVNRPGAGATVGTSEVVRAKNDGYTIGMSTNAALAYYPLVEESLPWSSPSDYQPIAKIGDQPGVLAVQADAPWKTFEDFVAAAKKEKGGLKVSSSGKGSSSDLIMREFADESEANLDVVPFSGGASEAEVAMLGGRVDANITFPAAVKGAVDAGRMRVLAVFQSGELPLYPDATPVNDAGYDVDLSSSFYVIGPKDMPDDVVDKLQKAGAAVAKTKEFKSFVKKNGSSAEVLGPDGITKELNNLTSIYKKQAK